MFQTSSHGPVKHPTLPQTVCWLQRHWIRPCSMRMHISLTELIKLSWIHFQVPRSYKDTGRQTYWISKTQSTQKNKLFRWNYWQSCRLIIFHSNPKLIVDIWDSHHTQVPPLLITKTLSPKLNKPAGSTMPNSLFTSKKMVFHSLNSVLMIQQPSRTPLI